MRRKKWILKSPKLLKKELFFEILIEASIFTIFSFSLREKEWRNVLIELFLCQEFDKSFDD